ncbi:uncharacterized protein LOC6582895 [Drosophila mojavensis]|uniref:uncharacterized protein LOC6582895 n=1 Tax=Drosophila mojavensis TaxID=7230 RepID=UPI001CD0E52D|nr:uncharacterized protein LOC6582895 [Drosophila mojavensis]
MKVTLLTVVTLTAVAAIVGAADPECVYRKLRGLTSHWPNPKSCSSYYRCTNKNVVRSIKCPKGKDYNPKTGKCSAARRGVCKLSLAAPLSGLANICASEVNGAYLPKSGYCSEFYICDEQLAYAQSCDAGSQFDITTNACIPDPASECWQNQCLTKENGVSFPSNTSCASYYVCEDKVATVKTCASGSYYSNSSVDCVIDENNSNCWENFCIGKTDGSMVADNDDCGAFYICSQQKATRQLCPTGSYFSESGLHCLPGTCPDKECTTTPGTTCVDGTVSADDEFCYKYNVCQDGSWESKTCASGSYFDKSIETCVIDENNVCPQCSTEGPITGKDCDNGVKDGETVLDPENCRLYFKCENGELVSADCGQGNYYDDSLNICVVDSDNHCCSNTTCTNETVSVDEENCNKYNYCENGTWISKTCPSGSYFDALVGACVIDENNVCPPCSTEGPITGKDCDNGTKDGETVLDPENCRLYFKCENGELVSADCGQGNYYDDSLNVCVVDSDNHCCSNTTCTNETVSVDEENCNKYNYCENGTWISRTCPSGSYFNALLGACVIDENNVCPPCSTEGPITGKDCDNGVKDGETVLDPENCRLYFKCENGELVSADCGQGNYYDDSLNICVVDSDNHCCASTACTNETVSVDEENCNKYNYCENGAWISRTCPSGSYFNALLGACVIDENNVCPTCSTEGPITGKDCDNGVKDGETVRDPENCRLYFKCENGELVSADCGQGSYYDDSLNICVVESTAIAAGGECKEFSAARGADNCWTYFACINGKWAKESCTGGFYFDASVGICRRDDNNQCPENKWLQPNSRSKRSASCNGLAEGAMQASTTECDMYVLCQNGELVEGTCGRGNIFSNSVGACVPDTDATCWVCNNKPNGFVMPGSCCSSYVTCNDGLAVPGTCDSGERFDGSSCIIDVTGQCINPCDSKDGNVAHPICSKYFECTAGVPRVMDCPKGEAFNTKTATCSATVTCNANQCATAADGATFPDPSDITRFYVCIDNFALIRSCPPNSAFDPTLSICLPQPSTSCDQTQCKKTNVNQVYASLTGDDSTFCLCETDGAFLKNCNAGTTFNATAGACLFTGPCDPQECVNAPEYSVSVNYDDPNSFCLCRANQPVSVPCPVGYTFNDAQLKCVLAPLADPRCCTGYCSGKPNGDTFASKASDTGFCLCMDELASFHSCPFGKVYDASLGVCLFPTPIIECPVNECDSTICATEVEYTTYPVANSVAGFCYCKESCGVYTQCPEGKEFDVDLLICLEAAGPAVCDATQCDTLAENEPYLALNGTEGFCYCQSGFPYYRLCPDGKQFDVDVGACLEVTGIISPYCCSSKCASLPEDATFASSNEEDDSSFCLCQGGEAYYVNCPLGKFYDSTVDLCLLREAPSCVCNPTGCAKLADYSNFEALNTTTGFCLCLEGIAVYQDCPEGKEYDAKLNLCLDTATGANLDVACDSTLCNSRTALTTFAAKDTLNGFCVCEASGVATYQSCGQYQVYDKILNICVVDACDPTMCKTRVKFDAFAARNTTSGFCVCDTVPTYYHCTDGHVFDETLGVCVHEKTSAVAACDPRDCVSRTQFEAFAAKGMPQGFCSCDGSPDIVTYHACPDNKLFDRDLGMCMADEHVIQKRSVEPEEKFICEANSKRSVPANCSQYEICLDGNWRKRSCSEERYYNPEQQRCLEPRDDMVCSYARVLGLPPCDASSESETIPSRAGKGSCLQYFRCAAGKWRLRSCPRRHYYAAQLSTCLPMPEIEGDDFCSWQNRSEGQQSKGCQHLTVRPYGMACDKFLMCMDNVWWIQQCPLGMYFSREINYCLPNDGEQCRLDANGANATACVDGQQRALATSCRSYEQCINGRWLTKTCAKSEEFEPQLGCMRSNGSCQGSGLRRSCQQGELRAVSLPDANCTQFFYYCNADEWHLSSCLRDNSFSRQLNRCQSLAKCQSAATAAAELKTQPSNSCLGQPDGLSVADATDCTRFYLCLQEQPALPQSCGSGSFFDALLGYCRPNDGSCRPTDSVCSNSTAGTLIAHPTNCQAYYNCSGFGLSVDSSYSQNATELQYCPKGQYFNRMLAQCQLDQGQCRQKSLSDSQGLCKKVAHGTRLPHQLYCNQYYACVHGLAFAAECEAKQVYNASLERCEPAQQSSECQRGQLGKGDDSGGSGNSSALFSCEHLPDGSYVADSKDCTRYYICAGGVALMQRCGSDSYFNAEQLLCTPDDGSCPYVINEAAQNLTNSTISSDQKPKPNPVMCEGKNGQLLPDLANCNSFYICISNKLRGERCYAGYFFNATLKQCQAYELAMDEDQQEVQELKLDVMETDSLDSLATQLPKNCSDAPADIANLCELIDEGVSIAEPGDCRRYISCEEDEPISQRCRNGESFDSLLGICRQNDGTCLMENGERVGVCSGKHGQLARDANNCRGYFVCLHGQKIEAECEAGQFFSKTTNSCETDVLQQCNNNSNELAKGDE